MLSGCSQRLDKLSKSLAQVAGLTTLSTGRLFEKLIRAFLYQLNSTAGAQKSLGFAQPKKPVFNLLSAYLYPLSTAPITNTKLI